MSGINGETRVPYSFKFELSLVCFLYITFAPADVLGHTPRGQGMKSPFFDDVSTREIEAIEGQTVIIPCTVRNLSYEKIVSWIRMKDVHILTSGPHAFASDYRFEVVHSDANQDFWGLRIRGVKADDTGQYECQVNTEPKMSLAYQLTVSKMGSDSAESKWLGYATIQGSKEVFVQHGSRFHMTCQINRTLPLKDVNTEVWWLHEDTQIQVLSKVPRISIETYLIKDAQVILSNLSLEYVTWQDSGLYTCLQPSVKKDCVKLVVVEAESSEAMQRDFPVFSRSTTLPLPLSVNILLRVVYKIYLLILYGRLM